MTKNELLDLVRVLADDITLPYLVSDERIESFIDEAEKEAFERSLIANTDNLYDFNVTLGVAEYTLNKDIFHVNRLKIEGALDVLLKTTKRELDFNIQRWESEKGEPKWYFQENRKITLYPIPDDNYKLLLDGYRYPTKEMETPEERHEDLAHWCLYRFFQIQDADILDIKLSQYHKALFQDAFGSKRSFEHDMNMRNFSQNSSMFRHPFS